MKEYVKPDFDFESFQLSTEIAACAWDVKSQNDAEVCGAVGDPAYGYDPEWKIFSSDDICTVSPDQLEDFCYFAGGDGGNVFNS